VADFFVINFFVINLFVINLFVINLLVIPDHRDPPEESRWARATHFYSRNR
jgi:hypothetical protein